MGLTTLFGTTYRSYYTISANFYLYLQCFQQKNFSFSKISGSRTEPLLFCLLISLQSLPLPEEAAHFKKFKQYQVCALLHGLSNSPLPIPKNNFQPLFFYEYLKIFHSLCVKICVSTHGLKSDYSKRLTSDAMLYFSHYRRKFERFFFLQSALLYRYEIGGESCRERV